MHIIVANNCLLYDWPCPAASCWYLAWMLMFHTSLQVESQGLIKTDEEAWPSIRGDGGYADTIAAFKAFVSTKKICCSPPALS